MEYRYMKQMFEKKYLNTDECAAYMGVHRNTILNYVNLSKNKKMKFPYFQSLPHAPLYFSQEFIDLWISKKFGTEYNQIG